MAKRQLRPTLFSVGDDVPSTGIYRVYHSDHRLNHELTLTSGHTFPPCSECKSDVRFELLVKAPLLSKDSHFKVQLYEIPHPRKVEGETA